MSPTGPTRWRLLLVLAGLGLAGACTPLNVPVSSANPPGRPPPGAVIGATVLLEHVSFDPSMVTIGAGQTVKWVWKDAPIPHNVTFSNFHSATMTNGTYYHRFDQPGTYTYSCTLHPKMVGTVIVK